MNKVLQIVKIVSLLSLVFLLCELGYTIHEVRPVLVGTGLTINQANELLQSVDESVSSLNNTLDSVNRPCGMNKPCGTLADINKTLGTLRGTLGQIEIAANHEDKQLGTLDLQEQSLFTNTSSVLNSANTVLLSSNLLVQKSSPFVDQLTTLTASTNKTVLSFDSLIEDPQIPLTLANVQSITNTGSHMLVTADEVETKATKTYLHPSTNPIKRTWQYASPFLLPSAQIVAATVR